MRFVFAAASLVVAALAILPSHSLAADGPVIAKLGVAVTVEVGHEGGRTIKPDPAGAAATSVKICNGSDVSGQFGMVDPVGIPPPMLMQTIPPHQCGTVRGNQNVAVWGQPNAWTVTVTFNP